MARTHSLQEFQRYVRTRCVESLGFHIRKIYMEAVRSCLHDQGYDINNPEALVDPGLATEEELVGTFNKKVVSELARCVV